MCCTSLIDYRFFKNVDHLHGSITFPNVLFLNEAKGNRCEEDIEMREKRRGTKQKIKKRSLVDSDFIHVVHQLCFAEPVRCLDSRVDKGGQYFLGWSRGSFQHV